MSSGDSSDIKTQPDAESWPTIAKLINEKEATLRRVLRWHAEAGFDSKYDESDMETRRLLDEELAKLTILELEAEAGGARQAAERDLMNAQALPKLAIASPAFPISAFVPLFRNPFRAWAQPQDGPEPVE